MRLGPKQRIAGAVVLVAVVALGLYFFVSGRAPQDVGRSEATVSGGTQIPPADPSVGAGAGTAVQPSGPTAQPPLMAELRATYRPGGLPARIRLQGELSDRWEKQVPTAAEVIGQIADRSAPDEHRVYIAQSFRNLAKMNRVMANEAADVVDRLLAIVGDATDAPLARGQLAVVLVGFDKSPEAVRTIAPLLNDANDDAGALAVTALRHAATDQAATALYEYLQRDAANRDAKPKTTASALLALTGYGKLDVVPVAKEIVMQTQSLELFQSALVSLSKAQSSVAVVDAILTAYDQGARLQIIDPIRVSEASIRALKQHARFIESAYTPSTKNGTLERAANLLSKADKGKDRL